MKNRPVILCIMDGIAYSKHSKGDAYKQAHTPCLDWLHNNFPHRSLFAHGTYVGLPNNTDMGNSEVGHNAIGSGQLVDQGAKLINRAIETKELFSNNTWQKLIDNALKYNSTLHFIGLLSDGNVHSHINHLKAMIEGAIKQGIKKIRFHILLDGRDVAQKSALDYLLPFEQYIEKCNKQGLNLKIASGGGRMLVTMDRYNDDWDMVKRGWEAQVNGKARFFSSAEEAIKTYRKELDCTDQYLPAFVITKNDQAVGKIQDNDSVIFFNFRGDRSIEISKAFDDEKFPYFDRGKRPKVEYAGMMQYDGDLKIPKQYLVTPPSIKNTMGEILTSKGFSQLAISETQKYGHVTFFFNGNRSQKFSSKLETYYEVPSHKYLFDEIPWMKSAEITNKVMELYKKTPFDFIRINYPNGDMVGHTGDFNATRLAVEAVDCQVKRLVDFTKKINGILIVTADHGNADEMFELKKGEILLDEFGEPKPKTSHSLNKVPFIIYDNQNNCYDFKNIHDASITSIAATCLHLLGLKAPDFYKENLLK